MFEIFTSTEHHKKKHLQISIIFKMSCTIKIELLSTTYNIHCILLFKHTHFNQCKVNLKKKTIFRQNFLD